MIMCNIVKKGVVIPVDEWGTPDEFGNIKYPIDPSDILFKNIKDDIILPIAEFFGITDESARQIDYFAMNPKRSYNSDANRDHICRYMNYFEKYYDTDRELLMMMYYIKLNIDYMKIYSIDNFMDDVNRFIIRNRSLGFKVMRFVDDNYNMQLSNNGGRTPNLQYNNAHAKVLYEISLYMTMYIPLATHYMYMHLIKNSADIQEFMLTLFDLCAIKYEEERGIDIYNKVYETALSVVNKSKNPDKRLWEKNLIRGNNPTTHTKESVKDIILQIIPKYTYDRHIINFNYYSNRKSLKYKITDIAYEYGFVRLSSSERDADQNSEYDRYESRLNKKDQALALQNKVAAEQSTLMIVQRYPSTNEEVEYYRKRLTNNGERQVINRLSNMLIGYMFYHDMGDPVTWKNVPNTTFYIKLMIAAKKKALDLNFVLLPYILSSRVVKIASRKVVSKNNTLEIANADMWAEFCAKYPDPQVRDKWFEMLGTIKASTFETIDWDEENNCPGVHDKIIVPMMDDIIDYELLLYANMI